MTVAALELDRDEHHDWDRTCIVYPTYVCTYAPHAANRRARARPSPRPQTTPPGGFIEGLCKVGTTLAESRRRSRHAGLGIVPGCVCGNGT